MKKNILFASFLTILFILSGCADIKNQKTIQPKAKYVFYFIGDGMGIGHVALTESYLASVNDTIGFNKLAMSDFPVMGLSTTYAENRLITGSAAAGTALATGSKTSIGTIGLASNHTDTLWSVAHYAKLAGYKVGILSSVSINHATPAAFYAHQPKRSMYYEIASEMIASNFDVFGGGGIDFYTGRNNDTTDIYLLLENAGYSSTKNRTQLNKLTTNNNKVIFTSNELTNSAALPYSIDQSDTSLNLADFTQKAIELLDNPNGFFMMIEGGKIDWAAHNNDGATVIQEVIDFDKAIKIALEFYKLHPNETLIVITADHETGGLSVGYDDTHYSSNLKILQNQKTSVEFFSDFLNNLIDSISVDKFNIDIALKTGQDFFGIDSLKPDEFEALNNAILDLKTAHNNQNQYANLNPIAVFWLETINNRAGIGWTTHSHSANPVPVRALGAWQELFDGYYDNTDIPKKIAQAMKVNML
ncbi:MAG: alkaline phosphatase [Bacteroidales bacterium]|nr:alkaline phosphatase [Bacteroidales bacterium]